MGPAPGATAETSPGRVSDDLVELLTVTQRRVARGVAAVLAEDGATLDGYRLLRSLAGAPGRAMGELVVALHLPAPTLTRLDALVRAHESALATSLGADRVAALAQALGDLAAAEA